LCCACCFLVDVFRRGDRLAGPLVLCGMPRLCSGRRLCRAGLRRGLRRSEHACAQHEGAQTCRDDRPQAQSANKLARAFASERGEKAMSIGRHQTSVAQKLDTKKLNFCFLSCTWLEGFELSQDPDRTGSQGSARRIKNFVRRTKKSLTNFQCRLYWVMLRCTRRRS